MIRTQDSDKALDQFNIYPNMPGATYAQSVWGASNVRSDNEHFGGDFEFLPKYAISQCSSYYINKRHS